ncbi:MAG TPA: RagB/SusD family nutrient uptake outer membrane protein [Gemmatimonadaceae bacterium]|nr:RagB/SusD family nutrient uptake outer membrane protein [Gemmatimonadaceae bacterium]
MNTVRFLAAVVALATTAACSEPLVPNLNNPTEEELNTITDRSQIQALATGLLDSDRQTQFNYIFFPEMIARDILRLDNSDPRYIEGLLGSPNDVSPSGFLGSGVWAGPYATIRGANLFISGVKNAGAITPAPLADKEKSAAIGFAQVVKALEYLRLIELRDDNGIPVTTGGDALAPIRCKPAVYAAISALLDSAITDLTSAGPTAVPFTMPAGWAAFSVADAAGTNTDLLGLAYAYKAKVEMYRGFLPLNSGGPTATPTTTNLLSALTALDNSFFNPVASRTALDVGIYHTYSTGAGETVNPFSDKSVNYANMKVITEGAEPGDLRVLAKVDTSPTIALKTVQGDSSRYQLKQPSLPTDPIAVLRNEELVLTRAEVLWGLNRDAEAVAMINIVRQAAGLPAKALTDFPTHGDVLRGILKEVRYSMLFESDKRWVDYRMFGILNELGKEVDNDPIPRLPIPQAEADARNNVLTCS